MPDKRVVFVERLLNKSRAGELSWEATEEEGEFQVAFTSYTVRTSARTSRSGLDIVIKIFNSEGALIEEFDDTQLSPVGPIHPFNAMKEIRDIARRTAMGVEQAFDSLLDELGE